MRLYGLLLTRDDAALVEAWCADQLPLYDGVVCLDGSPGDDTCHVAAKYRDRLVYLHERDLAIPHKTDHGLRRAAHDELVRRFGTDNWVMCCHPDEFCYHDPRKVARAGEDLGFDHVAWYTLQFYPHPNELPDWEARRELPVPERWRYYHWGYQGSEVPWVEDRLYRNGPGVTWDGVTHGNVRPVGLSRPAPFRPTLRHYKVPDIDPDRFEVVGDSSCYRHRWPDLVHRTGLPFKVRQPSDFFVDRVPPYDHCDQFEAPLRQRWNMGESYRPIGPRPGDVEGWYRRAIDLVEHGLIEEARGAFDDVLRRPDLPDQLRTLARNDLGILLTAAGEPFADAVCLDPTCQVAVENRQHVVGSDADRLATNDQRPEEERSIGDQVSAQRPGGRSRRRRVAVVSFLFNWPSTGGGTVHTVELCRFLTASGYDVRHIYACYSAWGVGQVREPLDYPTEPLEFAESAWNLATIQDRFRRAVEAFAPDHVVITDSWNMKPRLAEAVRGYPVILRLQALECVCPLNNVRLLPEPDGTPRQCGLDQFSAPAACGQCLQLRGHLSGGLHRAERALAGVGTPEYQTVLRRAFQEAAAVLVVNPPAQALLRPFARSVHVVTAGMDPARFPPTFTPVPDRPDGRRVILFAGLVDEWMKGFHVLHQACARLWHDRRDFELVATADPVGTPDPFTRFVGWQSQADLPRRLAAADVVAVPTVAQDALGRTAVEAMAAGRPVVASRLGGLPYTVVDGVTGLLCEPGDAADLAGRLARLLDDPDLRRRLGTAGFRRFHEHYAWPVIIDRHYKALLGGPTVDEEQDCHNGAALAPANVATVAAPTAGVVGPAVQIVGPDDGWVLEQLARRLARKLPYAEFVPWKPRPSSATVLAYYVNYALYQGPSGVIDVGFVTHRDDAQQTLDRARRLDACVCMNRAVADWLTAEGVAAAIHVPMAFDRTAYRPRLVLGVAGRLDHPRKGAHLLEPLRRLPFVDLRLTGGQLPAAQLRAFYQALDYLLIPATVEGGPLSLLEAVSMGKPVIAPDGVGLVPELTGGGHLRLFPAGDAAGLVAVVTACFREKEAISHTVADRTWDRWAADHHQVFSDLARTRGLRLPPPAPGFRFGLFDALDVPADADADTLEAAVDQAAADLYFGRAEPCRGRLREVVARFPCAAPLLDLTTPAAAAAPV